MAELLICVRDSNGTGPGQYKANDGVTVQEDGWVWGTKEDLPYDQGGMFGILQLPHLTVAELAPYVAEWDGPEEMVGYDDMLDKGIYHTPMLLRRLWALDISMLPAPFEATLKATGYFQIPGSGGMWNAFKNSMKNKDTGEGANL